MQEGVLASAPYALLFCGRESIKSREVTGVVLASAPLTAYFSRGRNILFQISGGAYSEVGHMPNLF